MFGLAQVPVTSASVTPVATVSEEDPPVVAAEPDVAAASIDNSRRNPRCGYPDDCEPVPPRCPITKGAQTPWEKFSLPSDGPQGPSAVYGVTASVTWSVEPPCEFEFWRFSIGAIPDLRPDNRQTASTITATRSWECRGSVSGPPTFGIQILEVTVNGVAVGDPAVNTAPYANFMDLCDAFYPDPD